VQIKGEKNVNSLSKASVLALSLVLIGSFASAASADTAWQKAHPRREQVNGRLANQNKRIARERREGDLTKAQAQDLRAQDAGIRGQERYDASHNGGHITKAEQHALNKQENAVSKEIGK
jgi:hypothetical protein